MPAIEQRLGQLGCVVGLLLGANKIVLASHALEQESELATLTINSGLLRAMRSPVNVCPTSICLHAHRPVGGLPYDMSRVQVCPPLNNASGS